MRKKERSAKRLSKTREKYAWTNESRKKGEKPKDAKGSLKMLARFLRPYLPLLVVVLFAGTISTVLSVIGPSLLGDAVNAVEAQIQNKLKGGALALRPITNSLLLLFAVYGSSSIFSFVQQYTMAGITQSIVRALREAVNAKLSRLPLKYYDDNSKGDILSRVMNDIDNISNTVQSNLVQILTSTVSFVGMLIAMIATSGRLTLYTTATLVPCLLLVLVISRWSRRYFRQQWDRTGELNGHVEEIYTGHNLVKAFDYEDKATAEFRDINTELTRVSRKAQFISGTIGPIINFVGNIGYVIICVVGGSYVLQGTMDLGGITKFFTYSRLCVSPLVDLGNIASNLQSSLASAERVFTLLDEPEEPADTPVHTLENADGHVRLTDVAFQYLPEKPLIESLNLEVKPGQLVAIVGPTGAGKTTIVNLLMRFYDVNGGSITVDGIDIRELSRHNLRSIFGMVLQDTWLFKGTIRENIAYGRQGSTDEEIENAAAAAQVMHFIKTLPDGLDTWLEEDGSNISQGQRQLLTIARAILADPAILILDEATSSVDTRTETLIQKAMKTLMQGRTNFVIAHRLSTIREADNILVMDNGGIVETGRHEDLLDKGGFYAKLYKSQFGAAIEESPA